MSDYERMKMEAEEKKSAQVIKWTKVGILGLTVFISLCMWGCPKYEVYSSEMSGKAEMAKAEQNRKIVVEEAAAENEAAVDIANTQIILAKAENEAMIIKAEGRKAAEIIRAEGMAEAMEIENGKLTPEYIQYLWVRNIQKSDRIYIPTETNIPILEVRK